MIDANYETTARRDFDRARIREIMGRALTVLRNSDDELLSLKDVTSIVKPVGEQYRGIQTVPIRLIAGSEGRYEDFNKHFLPRRRNLRERWERVDLAYHQEINLPSIKLYRVGSAYFVRDGNHRVSVAVAQGVEYIDAEVVELSTEVQLRPGMNIQELTNAVTEIEKKRFLEATKLDQLRPDYVPAFTVPGGYDELVRHVHGHKEHITGGQPDELPFEEAMLSWYDNVLVPIVSMIREQSMLGGFPGRTEADLYVWMIRHWEQLRSEYRYVFPLRKAVTEYARRYRTRFWHGICKAVDRLRGRRVSRGL